MKYIDAEELRTKVNELRQDWLSGSTGLEVGEAGAELGAAESILDSFDDIIDFFQQQPEVDLEKEIEEQINMYHNECEKKLNQMSDDDTDIGFLTLNNFARHFYELGLNARKK